jgi:hypothetical protein
MIRQKFFFVKISLICEDMCSLNQIFKIVFDSRIYFNRSSLVIGIYSFFYFVNRVRCYHKITMNSIQAVHFKKFTNLVAKTLYHSTKSWNKIIHSYLIVVFQALYLLSISTFFHYVDAQFHDMLA